MKYLVKIKSDIDPERTTNLGFPKVWDYDQNQSLQAFLISSGFNRDEADYIYLHNLYTTEIAE